MSNLDPSNRFGNFIRNRRIELGLTQAQLGYMIGSTNLNNPSSRISDLENGRGERGIPGTIILIKLAMALKCDLISILIEFGLIEACDNTLQINESVAFVEAWESSLDIKEAARLSKIHIESALAHRRVKDDVRDILKVAAVNIEYIYDFCFNRKPLRVKSGPILRSNKKYLRPHFPGPKTNGFVSKIMKKVKRKSNASISKGKV